MDRDDSPTARALLTLELLQAAPGITAARLAERLEVSPRAARRYVAILREAGVPIESVRGPGGGYRVGRGLRLPPLMFTAAQALGLVMAALDGRGRPAPGDPVDEALGKLIRVLPAPIAAPAEALRRVPGGGDAVPVDPAIAAELVRGRVEKRRLRLGYAIRPELVRSMDVDPWAVVLRRHRWYLLCWSHSRAARRTLRVDRIVSVSALPQRFEPPDLDPEATLTEHLSEGWRYRVEVRIDAPVATVAGWLPRSLGKLEPLDADRTRLLGTTDEPWWYARQLCAVEARFRVVESPELRDAVAELAKRLRGSVDGAAGA